MIKLKIKQEFFTKLPSIMIEMRKMIRIRKINNLFSKEHNNKAH